MHTVGFVSASWILRGVWLFDAADNGREKYLLIVLKSMDFFAIYKAVKRSDVKYIYSNSLVAMEVLSKSLSLSQHDSTSIGLSGLSGDD